VGISTLLQQSDLNITTSRIGSQEALRPQDQCYIKQHNSTYATVARMGSLSDLDSKLYSNLKNIEILLNITLANYRKQTYKIKRSALLIQKYKIINSAKQTQS